MAKIVFRLVRCLLFTLFAETAYLALRGVRKKQLLIVVLINCITNPLLVYTMCLIPFLRIFQWTNFILWFGEAVVFVIEGAVYKKAGFSHPFRWALGANLVSYYGGRLLSYVKILLL